MLMPHVWLQQQKQIYRLHNVRAGYVLYRALVNIILLAKFFITLQFLFLFFFVLRAANNNIIGKDFLLAIHNLLT